MITYTLKVVEFRKETEDTITLCFKQPALRKVKYKAGQFLTLIFRINNRRYIRPYSFSSTPAVDPLLEVTIKRIPNGIVSNYIHDFVQVGDSIEVMEPMGDFIYKSQQEIDQVFLWGVGSGITPLISLTKQLLMTETSAQVFLIYGNRTHESTIFLSLINKLLHEYPDRFRAWHFYTQLSVSEEIPNLVQGRITKEKVLSILASVGVCESTHFICGPAGFKESVKESIFSLNIPAERILSEDFELVKNPKDFEDIQSQKIELFFENKNHTLEVIKGKSVLESALDAGIELPYSCQTGNCSTCKGVLKEGNLKVIGLEKERDDLLTNEYLLCCSYPITGNVHIEV